MKHGLPVSRFQNVYGPREILGAASGRTPATIWRNVTPPSYGNLYSKAAARKRRKGIERFHIVDDIVAGLMACALKGRMEVYLASGVETTLRHLRRLLII